MAHYDLTTVLALTALGVALGALVISVASAITFICWHATSRGQTSARSARNEH